MGGNSNQFMLVMVGLAILMLGTFVLRPSGRGLDARLIFYAIRVGVMVIALLFGTRHRTQFRSAADPSEQSDPFADPYADEASSGGPSSSSSVAAGRGPKVMEFNWSATKPSQ